MRRGPGRPKLPRDKQTVQLQTRLYAPSSVRVLKMAEKMYASTSQALRFIVQEYFKTIDRKKTRAKRKPEPPNEEAA